MYLDRLKAVSCISISSVSTAAPLTCMHALTCYGTEHARFIFMSIKIPMCEITILISILWDFPSLCNTAWKWVMENFPVYIDILFSISCKQASQFCVCILSLIHIFIIEVHYFIPNISLDVLSFFIQNNKRH